MQIQHLSPKLKSLARKLTTNESVAEDLVSEMWVHLCEQWQKHPNQTAAWYVQSCCFHARDYFKRGRSLDSKPREGIQRVPLWHEPKDSGWESLATIADFEGEVISADLLSSLRQKLTDRQERILNFLVAGYTEQEIGTMEGVSQQAIHQQKRRIQHHTLVLVA